MFKGYQQKTSKHLRTCHDLRIQSQVHSRTGAELMHFETGSHLNTSPDVMVCQFLRDMLGDPLKRTAHETAHDHDQPPNTNDFPTTRFAGACTGASARSPEAAAEGSHRAVRLWTLGRVKKPMPPPPPPPPPPSHSYWHHHRPPSHCY